MSIGALHQADNLRYLRHRWQEVKTTRNAVFFNPIL